MNRRNVIQTAGITITGLIAGCTTDAGDSQNPAPDNETDTETDTETSTTDCTERPEKIPDLTLQNTADTTKEVEVTIQYTTEEERESTEYYHNTFEMEAGVSRTVRDIFQYDALSAEEAETTTYTAIARINETETNREVTAVAVDPYLYGITVDVTSDGMNMKTWHADPATATNWCPTPTVE